MVKDPIKAVSEELPGLQDACAGQCIVYYVRADLSVRFAGAVMPFRCVKLLFFFRAGM